MSYNTAFAIIFWTLCICAACGPQLKDHSDEVGDPVGGDAADDACTPDSCPSDLLCGEDKIQCFQSFGIGECINGLCSPAPLVCVLESTPEQTCEAACGKRSLSCVERGCRGGTAIGLPGDPQLCGSNTMSTWNLAIPIDTPCDQPLDFTSDDAFSLYQCCCDDPNI